ncbi:TetR/AcrR family transcriptional regulator [Streptosporangium sp. NPDC002524]|uniref:TetR/AcrR family transcriptional regulator n=1 Tax=Streptosporangium sp. NPDC002524 TaxID=3154537 RepID=UPI003328ED3D
MQVTKPPSLAATARRAQIVEAAIETIAELGYGQASFARIAERAGLSSTRLISYHFQGKNELIAQVVAEVYREIGEFMSERVRAEATAGGAIRAYITGNVEFIATHRVRMRALYEIFVNYRGEDGERSHDAATDLRTLSHIEEILRWGQREGEFRAFEPRVMAMSIQRSVDGLPFLLEADPDVDTTLYAAELVTIFDLATRSGR